ncbi:hypothetical protein F2Q70_00011800 [Brassica cretica]|uniref:Uncharacterized protein n=1 Tax=Brassica cretica TaxID=69181 RepID=A0A8S9M749_BRACR|nr:hypothetical protein F2Q70_00011800 [Brassica cretica]KAF3542763.1 hypothetical protein DY000_02007267 [Brassica cretica]
MHFFSPSLLLFPSGVLYKVREEETSKKKRRLSEKKKKRRRRLAFAVVMDIELVAIYTCQRHPCFRFSDPSFPVDKAEERDGGGGNKTVMWLEDVAALEVTRLWRRRKKTIVTSRLS